MVLFLKMQRGVGEKIVWVGKGVTRRWLGDPFWKMWDCKGEKVCVGAWMKGTVPSLGK